jgi:hypothetical protein
VVDVLTILVGIPKPVPKQRSRRAGFGTSQAIHAVLGVLTFLVGIPKPVPERSRRAGFGTSQAISRRGWCLHQPPTFIQLNSKFNEIKELNFHVNTLIFVNRPYIVVMETVKSTAKRKNFSTF